MRIACHLAIVATLAGAPSIVAQNSFLTLLPQVEETAEGAEAEVPLVSFEKLITFLPVPPLRWKAEAPTGSTTDNRTLRLSSARRMYYQGEGDDAPRVVITILDSTNNRDYFESPAEEWPANSESEDGYDRRVEVEGMRAFEHYSKAAKTSSLSVFVGERYFVQIEYTNGEPEKLKKWFKLIDIKGLAALK